MYSFPQQKTNTSGHSDIFIQQPPPLRAKHRIYFCASGLTQGIGHEKRFFQSFSWWHFSHHRNPQGPLPE